MSSRLLFFLPLWQGWPTWVEPRTRAQMERVVVVVVVVLFGGYLGGYFGGSRVFLGRVERDGEAKTVPARVLCPKSQRANSPQDKGADKIGKVGLSVGLGSAKDPTGHG